MKKSLQMMAIGIGLLVAGSTHAKNAVKKNADAKATEKHRIGQTIGSHPLYWDDVYIININNSYGTLIEPPGGYTIMDVALGDSKFYANELVNNRVRIKKIAPDNPRSNAHVILKGPDGITRSVTIELTGNKNPKISTVKFFLPGNREFNRELEAMKSKYREQMTEKLSTRERELHQIVHKKTVTEIVPFRLGSYPEKTSESKYGAKVYLDDIINSGANGYIYVSTSANDPECQVVRLSNISGKNLEKQVKLIKARVDRGMTHYVYETSPFTKTGKKATLKFKFKIYQKDAVIKATVL